MLEHIPTETVVHVANLSHSVTPLDRHAMGDPNLALIIYHNLATYLHQLIFGN